MQYDVDKRDVRMHSFHVCPQLWQQLADKQTTSTKSQNRKITGAFTSAVFTSQLIENYKFRVPCGWLGIHIVGYAFSQTANRRIRKLPDLLHKIINISHFEYYGHSNWFGMYMPTLNVRKRPRLLLYASDVCVCVCVRSVFRDHRSVCAISSARHGANARTFDSYQFVSNTTWPMRPQCRRCISPAVRSCKCPARMMILPRR